MITQSNFKRILNISFFYICILLHMFMKKLITIPTPVSVLTTKEGSSENCPTDLSFSDFLNFNILNHLDWGKSLKSMLLRQEIKESLLNADSALIISKKAWKLLNSIVNNPCAHGSNGWQPSVAESILPFMVAIKNGVNQ